MNSPYGEFGKYTKLNPYERIFDKDGNITKFFTEENMPNPIYDAKLPFKDDDRTKGFSDQLNVDWHINNDLRLMGKVKVETSDIKAEKYTSPYSTKFILDRNFNQETGLSEKVPPEDRGELVLSYGESTVVEGSVTLNYAKSFSNVHLLYAGVGSELKSSNSKTAGYTMTGFTDDRYADPGYAIKYGGKNPRPFSVEFNERSVGFFTNINYIYDSRYFADVSFRYDGSSKFGANNRFAPFWAVGGGWNLHNESFLKNSNISMLKLRASYGVTGNQDFDAYMARTTYGYHTNRLYENLIGSTILAYGNEDLKWQSTYQLNLGIDFNVFNERIKLSFDYYDKITDNLLTDITVAPSLGFVNSQYKENLGKIQNRGVDFKLNVIFVNKQDLSVTAFVQGIKNKNTLKKISNSLKGINDENNLVTDVPGAVYEEGQSMTAIKVVPSLGIDPYTGKEIYLKKNGDRTYIWDSEDKVICGDTEPAISGNFGGNIYWKGFFLNVGFQYSLGGDLYNKTLVGKVENIDPKFNADKRAFESRWSQPGDNALYKNIRSTEVTKVSSRFVQKNNYLVLNTLSLSYEFPYDLIHVAGIQSLRLNMNTTDLLRMSTVEAERGIDYPFQRSVTFGLAVTF